jgi:hypothetical protein
MMRSKSIAAVGSPKPATYVGLRAVFDFTG